MDAIEPNVQALAVFAFAWLVCCAGGFQLAGHLPLSEVPAEVRSHGGTLLIILDAALLLVLLAITVIFSHHELRWPFAIVTGGTIFLFSPFAVQDLPEGLKNGKQGLAALLLLLLSAIAVLLESGARHSIVSVLY
jgi:hypothetical protein